MKDKLIATFICMFLFAAMQSSKANQYPTAMTVTELNYETNAVVCEDCNGHMWAFKGTEDWEIGDTVAAIMDTNGTENIYDDKFVSTRYIAERRNIK